MSPEAHDRPVAARVQFPAPDDTFWTVYETRDPGSPTGKALLFVSESGFRRVRQYPKEWRSLSAQELWALSWTT
jgi:hypothetical protein